MLKNKKVVTFAKICCILAIVAFLSIDIKVLFFENNHIDTEGNYAVDLVYLWCDGNEPAFRERKNYWLERENKPALQAVADGRFEQVDELKYSLRSVAAYLPWINHIYIVTDRQVPSWLNTKHPKITVVDHSQIIPREYIPVFNANAIESVLYKIPGLSEHFLYANDDTFVNRPLSKSFFFKDGKPIVRLRKIMPLSADNLYHAEILYAIKLNEDAFGSKVPFYSKRNVVPHHNIDAYLKSDYADCANRFAKEYQETLTHRFRRPDCVQRTIVDVWSVMKKHSEVKILPTPKKGSHMVDSIYISNIKRNYDRQLAILNPGLFCINDTELARPMDREYTKHFLKKRFPIKSEFEL